MKKDLYEDFGGRMYKCDCGKIVIPTHEWIYKIKGSKTSKTKYFCSYTCWRKAGGDSGKDPRFTGTTKHKRRNPL